MKIRHHFCRVYNLHKRFDKNWWISKICTHHFDDRYVEKKYVHGRHMDTIKNSFLIFYRWKYYRDFRNSFSLILDFEALLPYRSDGGIWPVSRDSLSYWFDNVFYYLSHISSSRQSFFVLCWISNNFFQIFDEISLWIALSWIYQVSIIDSHHHFWSISRSREIANRTKRYFETLDFSLSSGFMFWWSWGP